MQSQIIPALVLAISSISWGLTWIPLKYFNGNGIGGIGLVFVAYGSAALVLLPWLIRQRAQWMSNWPVLLWLLVLGGYSNLAFSYAMVYGEVVRAMVLFYLSPVWAVIGGRIFLKEHIDAMRWTGVTLALVGAFLIVGGYNFSLPGFTFVDFVAVSAGFAFAMTNIIFRGYAGMPIVSNVTAVFIGCALMSAVLIIAGVETLPVLSSQELFWVTAYGCCWILMASIASQWAVTKMEASRSAVIIIMELVAATISATLLGIQTLTLIEIIGALLVVSATLLETVRIPPTPKTQTIEPSITT